MSKQYTTGEMAKLCGVTVRTVQYYDKRGILIPSQLTEGGRRLYTEVDLKTLRLICYLKNLGLSLDNIANILKADNRKNVISTILQEQIVILKNNISEQRGKLAVAQELFSEIENCPSPSVEFMNDIVTVMENKNSLRKAHIRMIIIGLIADAIEVSTLLIWIFKGIWIPFAVGMVIAVLLIIWLFNDYYKRVSYICPDCHTVFKAGKKEFFFSKHTPKTRKLTCPNCNHKTYCVETGDYKA